MGFYRGKLIELSKKGNSIIVTDIHGNITDYNKYLELWKNYGEKNFHFIITGDFIHAMGKKDDRSIDILESVMHHFKNFKNSMPCLVTMNGLQSPWFLFTKVV